MKQWIKKLEEKRACQEAIDWCQDYDSLQEAWQECKRGDWMLWLISHTTKDDTDRKPLVLVACQCARLALPYITKGDGSPLKAIETAEAWARGEATIEEVRKAANAAAAAAAAYAADAAANAAAAAYAAYAASGAARAAADAAADAAAQTIILLQCADIVRKYYPNPPVL